MEYSNEYMSFTHDPTQMQAPERPAPRRRKKVSTEDVEIENRDCPIKRKKNLKAWPDSGESENSRSLR